MANFKNELRSGYNRLRLVRDDLHATSFARRDWNNLVWPGARSAPIRGSNTGFSPSIFWSPGATGEGCSIVSAAISASLKTPSRRRGPNCPLSARFLCSCWHGNASWTESLPNHGSCQTAVSDRRENGHGQDVQSLYCQIVRSHERADTVNRAKKTRPRFAEKETVRKKWFPGVMCSRRPRGSSMSKTSHWSNNGMNCRGECRTRPPHTCGIISIPR